MRFPAHQQRSYVTNRGATVEEKSKKATEKLFRIALPLFKQAMEIRRVALGERHPDYADSLNNLAELYRATGRHAEAEQLSREASGS